MGKGTGVALLALPSTLGIVLFALLPVCVVLWLSLTQWDLLGVPEFVGLQNYTTMFGSEVFWGSLVATSVLLCVVVPAELILALLIAVPLSRKFRGATLIRSILVVPWVAAPIAIGVIWSWIVAPDGGLVSQLVGSRIDWINDPSGAVAIVAIAIVWTNVGYLSLFFIAGLNTIPQEIGEAAMLDGAGSARRFVSVTLPLMRPTVYFVAVIAVAQQASAFDQIWALTGGGPSGATDVVAIKIFANAFQTFDLGGASALSLVLLLALFVLTLLLARRVGASHGH